MNQIDNKSVIVVIVTYNRRELLKKSITALLNQNYDNLKILVVDNNSTDGTCEYIGDVVDDEKIIYINTGENLGGAYGFYFGIKNAITIGCDYIWLMDDDCIVNKNTLSNLLSFAKEKQDNFGYLSSVVNWTDGSICKMNVQRLSISKKVSDFNKNQNIKIASFVSMLIKPSTVLEVGLPIKEFFIWGDDWEYTYRISKKFDCYLVAKSKVTHKMPQNIASNIANDSLDRLPRYFYDYRNEGYLYRQAGLYGRLYYFAKKVLHVTRIIFAKSKNKKQRLQTLIKGSRASRKFHPSIEYV